MMIYSNYKNNLRTWDFETTVDYRSTDMGFSLADARYTMSILFGRYVWLIYLIAWFVFIFFIKSTNRFSPNSYINMIAHYEFMLIRSRKSVGN